jgi:septal ring factor EnvC (AmiA/AmiB activator)
MALKATDIPAASPRVDAAEGVVPSSAANHASHAGPNPAQTPAANPALNPQLNPEEQELARKRDEQTAIEGELAERELRSANLRAELGAFERQYLHHVGSRYAELDELKAAVAERLAQEQPANDRAQQSAREARARAAETQSTAGEKSEATPRAFESSP